MSADSCHVCSARVEHDVSKCYIFSKRDRDKIKRDFGTIAHRRQGRASAPKVVCEACLQGRFERCERVSEHMDEDEFYVVRDSVPRAYKIRDVNDWPKEEEQEECLTNNDARVQRPKKSSKKSQVKNNNPLKVFQCHICLMQLNRKSRLRLHLQRHGSKPTMAKVFCCSYCKMAFKDLMNAQEHVNRSECAGTLESLNNNNNGVDNFDGGKIFDEEHLAMSNLALAQNIPLIVVDVVEISEVYRCEFCDKVYCEKVSLKNHIKVHQGMENMYSCSICNAAFPSYSKCSRHKITHRLLRVNHKFIEIPDVNIDSQYDKFPVVKLFLCDMCDMSFFDRSYFIIHKKNVHANEILQYNCIICNKLFSSGWALRRHNKKHHKENNGSDSKLNDRSNLQINSTEPSYQCNECGNTFLHSSSLRTHKSRIHKRGINAHCPHCNKSFYDTHDLKRHITIHSDERPFPCDDCKQAFRHKNAFNEHKKVHSDKRPYSCDVCGTSFKRSRGVKTHRLTHTKKRVYKCQQCQQCFKCHATLRTHVQNDHTVLLDDKDEFEFCELIQTEEIMDPISLCDNITWDISDTSQNILENTPTLESLLPADSMDSVIPIDNRHDIVLIQQEHPEDPLTDGQFVISNEIFDGIPEGDYLIFNEDVNEADWDNLQILDGTLCVTDESLCN